MPNEKMISIREKDQLMANEDYKEHWDLKQEILKEYPPLKLRTRKQHLECIKRIGDLIWDINGPFQRFIDSQVSEIVTIKQMQKVNKKKTGRKYDD